MQGEQQDYTLGSRGPHPFRTALCCRLLTSLAEEMVSEQHREVFQRISYELMLSIYADYMPPPRSGLGDLSQAESSSTGNIQTSMFHTNKYGKAATTGLNFDLVPFFRKVQTLEEQMAGLHKELEDLRAWKTEKAPLLRELREDLDIATRARTSAGLALKPLRDLRKPTLESSRHCVM